MLTPTDRYKRKRDLGSQKKKEVRTQVAFENFRHLGTGYTPPLYKRRTAGNPKCNMRYKRRRMRRPRRRSGKYLKRRRQNFYRKVRKAVLKTAEVKYKMVGAEATSLYHDRGTATAGVTTTNQGPIIWNPWYDITKGTTKSQRIGDQIYPTGISLRFCYWAAADRQAQFLRMIVAILPKVDSNAVTNGANYDLLDPAGSNDTVTGMPKAEGLTILYDKMITMKGMFSQSGVTVAGEQRVFRKIWIRAKKGSKITWNDDGAVTNRPMAIFAIPYDEYATLRSDILGTASWTYKLYFKDV